MAGGFVWEKVEQPKAWRPKNAGEELVGEYLGKTVRPGNAGSGSFEVATIRTAEGTRTVASVILGGLLDAAKASPS